MELNIEILLYAAIFVGTLLFIEGLFLLVGDMRGGKDQARNRRMQMIASGKDTKTTLHKLRRDVQGPFSQAIARFVPSIDKLVGQAGMTMSMARLLTISILLFVLVFALTNLLSALSALTCLAIGLMAGTGLPYFFLRLKRRRRTKRFAAQLPDTLDLIVRSLRAGHPVSSALDLVCKEMPDPAGTEFGIVVDEMTYGLDIHDALRNLAERVPHEDLKFVVVSVQIQYMIGGNLAEVLANLSSVIRERFQMFKKIRAISAEGRFSGMIVGGLPVIVAAVISLTAPTYFSDVSHDPLFWRLIGAGIVLLVLGQLMIYKMVNFRV